MEKQERENRERKQIEVRQKIPKKPPKRDDEQRRRERELKKMVQLATEGAREAQWEYLRFKEDMKAKIAKSIPGKEWKRGKRERPPAPADVERTERKKSKQSKKY